MRGGGNRPFEAQQPAKCNGAKSYKADVLKDEVNKDTLPLFQREVFLLQ